jgi:serine/threonine protein kinase
MNGDNGETPDWKSLIRRGPIMNVSATMSATESQPDRALAKLVDELAARIQAGEQVDLETFAAAQGENAEALRQLFPAIELLADLGRSIASGASPSLPSVTSEDGPTGTLGDFRIIREIGRGGMGIVYEAEQISLGRRVALKVLPFAGALDAKQLQRFKNEAQAAAHLHHTNIVPVFYVGSERGVHHYAMQLIEGCTLAQVISDLRSWILEPKEQGKAPHQTAQQDDQAEERPEEQGPEKEAPGSKLQDRSSKFENTALAVTTEGSITSRDFFRNVAQLGIQAAEALEHAHQMGVVHRDIKPGNLLFDRTPSAAHESTTNHSPLHLWITDFGLAQFQTGAELTMTGDLIGTLRYMSPEQALAKPLTVDHRTDVYSLGATLYELLTLRPAFGGTHRQELLRQIAFEEPKPPRRLNKAIPPELETIVRKAMEKNPADRYGTAKEIAADLQHWLDDKPIRARKPTCWQRMRKVARRHPEVTVTAAAATVIGLLLGIAGLAVNNRMVRQGQLLTQAALDHAEQEKAIAEAVRDFLSNKLLAQADPRTQANTSLKAGSKSTGAKPNPTIRELLDRAALELAPDKIELQFPGQPLVQAQILKTIGEAYGGIGEYRPALAHLERARDMQRRELNANHADTLATMNSLGRTYLDAGKPADAARLFEQVRDLRIETLGPDHPETLESMNDLSRAYFKLKLHDKALQLRKDIVRLRTEKLGPAHRDTLESMNNLANSYAALRRLGEALELHQKTLALRQATLGADHPHSLMSLNNVANCYTALGQHEEALRLHEEILAARRSSFGEDDRETLLSMNNVAYLYGVLGRHADAIRLHQRTLELRTAKLGLDHPDTLYSMNALAWMLATAPDLTLRNPGRAVELSRKAVDLAPNERDYRNTLGVACYRVGDWKGAVTALGKSMELSEGGDCSDWFFLAMARWRLGDKDQARKWYDKAVGWMEKEKSPHEELHRFRPEAAELLGITKK